MNRNSVAVALSAIMLMAGSAAHAEAPSGPRAEVVAGWNTFDGSSRLNDDGVVYGFGLGYDHAISSKSSIGVDAEISGANNSQDTILAPGITSHHSTDRNLYAGVRYTYNVVDRVNLFATAGYSNQRIEGQTSLGGFNASNLDGFNVGAGAQYNVSDNVYLTSAYRYTDFEGGLRRHQVVGGIGFRF